MRRLFGRIAQTIIVVGAVLLVGRAATSGVAQATERTAFLPLPTSPQAIREREGMDVTRVRALLDAARGANTVACELAAAAVDGHSWSSHGDGDFRAGGSGDSVARDIAAWVHNDVDPAAIPILSAAIADRDWCVRRLAAPLLGRVRNAASLQAMHQSLGAADAGTREMAALALGFAEDPRSIPPLVARLKDDAPRVRATAAWALGEIDRKEAVRPLMGVLGDSDALVRESVAHALGELEDTAAVSALTDLLKSDREPTVRRAAARALGEIIG